MGTSHAAGTAEHQVVVAGGGPTGLMLAGELALAGVDVVVVERRATQEVEGTRARGIHARTIEVLDQRGIADRFLSAGWTHPQVGFAMIPLDAGDLPTRHPYLLALVQADFERILAGWVHELGVPIRRPCEVVGFRQDADGVDVELSDGGSVRAAYLVGCDGGRSTVRKAAGIDFVGMDASTSWITAEVVLDDPPLGLHPAGGGIGPVDPARPDGPFSIVLVEPRHDHDGEATMDDLRAALDASYGSDFGARDASWISRFTDMARQAASYRDRRVLLAGDAAHVHPPQGGQGMGAGVQDAVNLGWKLAQVVHGVADDDLLDSYHAERHPVGAGVLRNTAAQVALTRPDERSRALHGMTAELLAFDEPRRRIAAMISGLDLRYDLGDAHPLVGWRMPDLDVEAPGASRVAELLHDATGVLLLLGAGQADVTPWGGRVRAVEVRCAPTCELPSVGEVELPAAVLVRPDGHVAWAGDPTDPTLAAALRACFGGPTPGSTGGTPR